MLHGRSFAIPFANLFKLMMIARIPNYYRGITVLLGMFIPCFSVTEAADEGGKQAGIAEYRIKVLSLAEEGEAALPELRKALQHENVLVRCAAIRSLHRIGQPAEEILHKIGVQDADPLVRRTALRLLAGIVDHEEWTSLLTAAYQDSDPLVREAVVEELAVISARDGQVLALLRQAQQDSSTQVSRRATEALWPYHGEVRSARLRPEYQDLHLQLVEKTALPVEGWLFQTDPSQNGHVHGWQTREFEPVDWNEAKIATSWQKLGFEYEGVAWYRLLLELPEKPDYDVADLLFEGVDQSAWVWVNGQYVGSHDLGWNVPFTADVGDILEWGKVNQISVRVLKTAGGHAGIWKPVYLELWKR